MPRPPRRAPASPLALAPVVALVLAALSHAVACGAPKLVQGGRATPAASSSASDAIELVESAPVETTLNHADLRDAADVWPAMIGAARTTLDLAGFYVSDAPESRMHAVIGAIEAAAARGVRVRLLIEKAFHEKYPEPVDALARRANVELRLFDLHATMGGILHAKYFVVDGRSAFVGSQNFDWRALEHIQEIGVRLESPTLAGQLDALFDADWDLAGATPPAAAARWARAWDGPKSVVTADGTRVRLAASPRGFLPDDALWDLPQIVAWLDEARTSVDVQLLTYKPATRAGDPFLTLDDALRRAAARGVRVRLLVSHWGKRDEGLARLAKALPPPSSVRVITIPPTAAGEIPFARVAHAKYAVVDGARAWIGTSNWEGDYFLSSRNVSVLIEGAPFAARLGAVFDDGWSSAYASPLLP